MPQQTDATKEEIPVREDFPENKFADLLFSDKPIERTPIPDDNGEEEEIPVKPVTDKPEEEADMPAKDEDDLDWDKPLSDKVKKPEDGELDLDTDPANETEARKQAKLRGQEAKRLRHELEELRLERERIAEERDKLKTRAEEYEASLADPSAHPDFVALRNEILEDVNNAAELMPLADPSLVGKHFGSFVNQYIALEGLTGTERAAKINELKGSIVSTLAAPDIPWDEMTDSEKSEYSKLTSDVLAVVQRNVRPTKKLGELHNTLESKAKSGVVLKGVREYGTAHEELKPALDMVGDLPDDVIAADPFSPASVVAAMLKDNPQAKSRVDAAKNDVLELVLGPRPLTLDEVKRLETNGTDVRKFLAEREVKHREKQKRLIPLLVQGLLTRATLKSALAELDKFRKNNDAKEGELDALRSIGKGTPAKKTPVPEKKVDPLEKLFSEG